MANARRLLAVDPSLTCSGWALFNIATGELLGVGEIRSLPASHSCPARFSDLQTKVTRLYEYLSLGESDLVVCEAPTTMRDPRAAVLVEQVRSMFEVLARARESQVPGRLNPRSVQFEVMGLKGRQAKRKEVKLSAVAVAHALYGSALGKLGVGESLIELSRHQDLIDAVLVGSLAVTRVQSAMAGGLSLDNCFQNPTRTHRASIRGFLQ